MTTYKIIENDEIMQTWTNLTYTNQIMEVDYGNGNIDYKRIIKGKWTPSGYCRDCGDYYIVANYASYTKINKNDMSVENDVEDD